MAQLLSNFGKQGVNLGLLTMKVDIEDTEHLSKYFVISEYNPVFLAGRNPIAFNGSSYLADRSEIQVECLDFNGNSLYIEQAKSSNSQFTDVSKFVASIHIYAETYNGPGKLILVGTTKKGEIVRWIGNITIDKTLTNACKVRFYSGPTLEVRSLLYPVVDTRLASQQIPPVIYKYPTAKATVKTSVYSVVVTNGGIGYTQATTTVTIPGASAYANIVNGSVASITITSGGSGYTTAPSVTINSLVGTGATAVANITGMVDTVTVLTKGSGYTVAPTITFMGVGALASAVANLVNGTVDTISVTNGGYGYSSVPSITFSAPNVVDAPILNVPTIFSSSFYGYAVNPPSNTDALVVDKKRTPIDYRIILTKRSDLDTISSMSPTGSFNTQMEGSLITFNVKKIQNPSTKTDMDASVNNIVSNTFTIKKVVDSTTAIISDPFYYQNGKTQFVTDITDATCTSSYDFIQYNTNPESFLLFQDGESATPVPVKQSYAEVTYRNLKTYSGFVARHKLYRRSLFHPGDFQLISDEPLKAIELLSDIITFNKAYVNLGVFYNKFHTDKYWNLSDNTISITHQVYPINSAYIAAAKPSVMDGSKYVILKTDSVNVDQDNIYYPYDKGEFDKLTGKSYNSNFVSLKKNTLYAFSTNIIMDKDYADTTAKVSFYFTSSISSIKLEKDYNSTYGLKIAEVSTTDQTKTKYFKDKQIFYFTPTDDYYGTLVIVPYHCNVTLSEVSLKVYGDYGFSPDILFIRVPFEVNIANESFELKAELFDINSNLIYSDFKVNQTFDKLGESIQTGINLSSVAYNTPDPAAAIKTRTVFRSAMMPADDFYLPNLSLTDGTPSRLVGWKFPDGSPNSSKLIYTNISKLLIDSGDYITLSTVDTTGLETTVKSLGIKNLRHLFVDLAGVKHLT